MLHCTVKWRTTPDPSTDRYSLFRFNPDEQQFVPVDNRRITIGQVLCHIGGCQFDHWYFVAHTVINNFCITFYRYQMEGNVQDLIIIDYLEQGNIHNTDCSEEYPLENHKLCCDFSPEEYQTIYNLLIREKANFEKGSGEDMINQYRIIANMAGRMRHDMDSWLHSDPQHPYTQWRIAELRDYIAQNVNLFEYHKEEDQNE